MSLFELCLNSQEGKILEFIELNGLSCDFGEINEKGETNLDARTISQMKSLLLDSKGNLWAGSGALHLFNRKTKRYKMEIDTRRIHSAFSPAR